MMNICPDLNGKEMDNTAANEIVHGIVDIIKPL